MILYGKQLKINKLTCLYFYEENDIFSKKYFSLLEKTGLNKKIDVLFVDINSYKDLVTQYKIEFLPTFLFIKQKELGRIENVVSSEEFNLYCDKILKKVK